MASIGKGLSALLIDFPFELTRDAVGIIGWSRPDVRFDVTRIGMFLLVGLFGRFDVRRASRT